MKTAARAAIPSPVRAAALIAASALCLAWAVGAEWVSAADGFPGNHLLEFLSGVSFLGAGLYALARRPRNAIGWLLLSYGILWFANFWATLLPPLGQASVTVIANAQGALLVHIALAFPGGRIATRFGRAIVLLGYAWSLVASFAREAVTDRTPWDCAHEYCRATLSMWLWPSSDAYTAWNTADGIATLVIVIGTVAAFGQRWLRSTPVGRRELRPLWLAVGLVSLGYVTNSVASLAAAGEAVLGVVADMQSITQMLAPLIIAYGLLNARMASSAVGDNVADLRAADQPHALESAIGRVLQDPGLRLVRRDHAGIWRDGGGSPLAPDSPELTTAEPILGKDGAVRGVLVHDPGLDRSAVRAAAATVGLLIENESLRDELAARLIEVQASRARLVSAGDAERKRVERDLHDGAQQRLLALTMALRTARRQADAGDADLAGTLDQASAELLLAIDELRTLARGLHPSILTDAGLGPAVRALVERSPGDVELRELPSGRLPASIEAAAYFVVAESLANVVKHAGAQHAWVRIRVDEGELCVEAGDDGVGGADIARGSGLRGLDDRVAAARGTLTVESPSGQGTTVRAVFPLSAEGDG